jgi:outer membrane lipoprotein carrier protein LolA
MRARPTARPRSAGLLVGGSGSLAAFLLTAWSSLFAAEESPLDLNEILARTTVIPPARVAFHEERHNPMLEEPLLLTGYLEYLDAGVLRKVIETPARQSFLIEGNQVSIEREGETRKLSLNRSRALKTILGAIEAILAGKPEKLESVFDHELSGSNDAWSIRLTPVSQRMRKQLANLRVDGDGMSATSIRFELNDGEWHRMVIIRDASEQ